MQTLLSRQSRQRFAPGRWALTLPVMIPLLIPGTALGAGFKITAHMRNHTPIANTKWPVKLTVMSGHKRLSGSVNYEFLFSGSVVSHQPGHRFKHGIFKDTMVWPAKSVGLPLTLRILVHVPRYRTEHLDWQVTPEAGKGTSTATTATT